MGALKRFVDDYFKMPTQVNVFDSATIAGATLAAPNNPDRLMLLMMNLSDIDMVVSPDKRPTAAHGILLQNGGGSVSLSAKTDGELVGYEWNVFCTDVRNLFVLEMEGAG